MILVTATGTAPVRAAARFMPITVFLAGQAFELEDIQAMSAAFVAACDALHLKISDPAARFVAEKVIALARMWHPRSGCASHNHAERGWIGRRKPFNCAN
jgi:hypothetical protein